VGSATLTDEEVERVEKARAARGAEGERSMLDTIEAERAERLAAAAERDAEFDAAAPTRDAVDAAHAEAEAQSGEPSDVPGVRAGTGLDPALEQGADGQLQVAVGDPGKFTFNVGGKAPTSVSLRLAGGKVEVGDEYDKGSLVRVTYVARVGGVHFDDKVDPKTKQVVACEKKQIATPVESPTIEPLS
jgi:hypothetical protein